MATGDFQQFRPSDSAFMNPGELTESWRTMALERATEQSNLERLYRTLEQEQGQFEDTLGEKKYEFDKNLSYLYNKMSQEGALANRGLSIQESEEDRAAKLDWLSAGMDIFKTGTSVFAYGEGNDWWNFFGGSDVAESTDYSTDLLSNLSWDFGW